jgi:hypothetical protein
MGSRNIQRGYRHEYGVIQLVIPELEYAGRVDFLNCVVTCGQGLLPDVICERDVRNCSLILSAKV